MRDVTKVINGLDVQAELVFFVAEFPFDTVGIVIVLCMLLRAIGESVWG
jgi:hypothetical protein